MTRERTSRWLIIGNSGSGKSTLAEHVGTAFHLPVYDLDLVHWTVDRGKRQEIEAMHDVAEIAAGDDWVIEGVYGWLAEVALPRADTLIWLDLSWDECRAGLLARGPRRGMGPSDQNALLAWAEAYWTRTTPTSFAGHERIYRGFEGDKARLHTRDAIAAAVARRSTQAASSDAKTIPVDSSGR